MTPPLAQVRAICMSHPLVEERLSHGEPTWFYKGKRTFAMFADHHHDNRVAVWLAAPPGVKEMLMESNPHRFFSPPYVGVKGWVGVFLDVPIDNEELVGLVSEAYQFIASKK